MKIEIEVTDDNPFNAGWLGYVLGQPRPDPEADPVGADGWDTGKETSALTAVRYVFSTQQQLVRPQYIVRMEAVTA